MDEIFEYIYRQPILKVTVVTAAVMLAWLLLNAALKNYPYRIQRSANAAGVAFSVYLILYATLFSRGEITVTEFYPLPFHFIVEAFERPDILRSAFLNIVLFVPLGMTLPFLFGFERRKSVLAAVIIGFFLSLSVELLQLVLSFGRCEADDVVMNTLGTAVGTLVYCAYNAKALGNENDK